MMYFKVKECIIDGAAFDIEKAEQTFATAYNNGARAVSTAIKGTGTESGVANDAHARLAANDLKSVVANGIAACSRCFRYDV